MTTMFWEGPSEEVACAAEELVAAVGEVKLVNVSESAVAKEDADDEDHGDRDVDAVATEVVEVTFVSPCEADPGVRVGCDDIGVVGDGTMDDEVVVVNKVVDDEVAVDGVVNDERFGDGIAGDEIVGSIDDESEVTGCVSPDVTDRLPAVCVEDKAPEGLETGGPCSPGLEVGAEDPGVVEPEVGPGDDGSKAIVVDLLAEVA